MADDERPEFSVWVFYADEYHDPVVRFCTARYAVQVAHRLTRTIEKAAQLSPDGKWPTKVVITDGGDDTVFLWERGRGVVFPTEAQLKEEGLR